MSRALLALAVASFGIGTTEFVMVGLLPDMAADLGVSIPRAGLLVTGYALAVAIGAPPMALLTARLERRSALVLLMGFFTLGNALCAIAPSYWLLMAARLVTALNHGAFFGIGSVVASRIVAPEKRAQAIALMFAGMTLANVLGVPAGTWLGQAMGWRAPFWIVTGIGVAAMLALLTFVPRMAADAGDNLLAEFAVLKRPQVLLAMGLSLLASVCMFTVFTYVAPLLEQVAGLSPHGVGLVLLAVGVGLSIGNLLGGRLADWRLMQSVLGLFAALAATLVAMHLGAAAAPIAITLWVVWAAITFALVSPLQMRVVDQAVGAPNLAATLNQGAFNLGNAIGAFLGGAVIDTGLGLPALPLVAASVAVLAMAITRVSMRLDRHPAPIRTQAEAAR